MRRRQLAKQPLPERIIWRGKPSNLLMILDGDSFLCILLCWLIIPIFPLLWKWLTLLCTKYFITSHRLRISKGVFNFETDEVELFRVMDLRITKPLLYRIFGLGNLHVITRDKTRSHIILKGIPQVDSIYEEFRLAILNAKRDWQSPWI